MHGDYKDMKMLLGNLEAFAICLLRVRILDLGRSRKISTEIKCKNIEPRIVLKTKVFDLAVSPTFRENFCYSVITFHNFFFKKKHFWGLNSDVNK
jgi:hypothetical protein